MSLHKWLPSSLSLHVWLRDVMNCRRDMPSRWEGGWREAEEDSAVTCGGQVENRTGHDGGENSKPRTTTSL